MKRRILSLILVAVMVLCMVPAISLVSFASADYTMLPDDANKAHFLSLIDAYADEVDVPSAEVINAKLVGYKQFDKEMTSDEKAEMIATTLSLYFLEEDFDTLKADIKAVIEARPAATTNGLAGEIRTALLAKAILPRTEAEYIVREKFNATAATWAQAVADVGIYVVGTSYDLSDEASKAEYVTYLTGLMQTVLGTTTNQNEATAALIADLHFRGPLSSSTLGANGEKNSEGFRSFVLSAVDQMFTTKDRGTNKIKDFYLNFTDVAVEGEAAKFEAILDYYFSAGRGNFGYYEDLWYDDGHLVEFIDLSGFNSSAYTTTVNSELTYAEDDVEKTTPTGQAALTPAHFARFVEAADFGNSEQGGQDSAIHSFVKVVGGTNIGRYMMVGFDNGNVQSIVTEVDSQGYLRIYQTGNLGSGSDGGFSVPTGIYTGYLFNYSMLNTQSSVNFNAWKHMNGTQVLNYWQDNGMSVVADEYGSYGGFTMQASFHFDKSYWNPTNYPNLYSQTANNFNIHGSPVGKGILGGFLPAGANSSNNVVTGIFRIGAIYVADGDNIVAANYGGLSYNSGPPIWSVSVDNAIKAGDMVEVTLGGNIVDANKRFANPVYVVNGYNCPSTTANFCFSGLAHFIPCINANQVAQRSAVSNYGYMTNGAVFVTQDKQIENFRTYDISLTDAERARNHFADLVYALGLELSDMQKAFIVENGDTTFYSQFAKYNYTSETADTLRPLVEALIDNFASEDNIWYIENYRDIYAQTEDLYAEIDFTAINANTIGTFSDVRAGKAPNYIEPDAGNTLEMSHGAGLHAYVKITAGWAAGDYFLVGIGHNSAIDYTATGVDAIAEDHPFLNTDGTWKASIYDTRMGIGTGYRFSISSASINYTLGSGAGFGGGYANPCYYYNSVFNDRSSLRDTTDSLLDDNANKGTGYTIQYAATVNQTETLRVERNLMGFRADSKVDMYAYNTEHNKYQLRLASKEIYNLDFDENGKLPFGYAVVGVFDGSTETTGRTTAITTYYNGRTVADSQGVVYTTTQNQPNSADNGFMVNTYGYNMYYFRIYTTNLTAEEIATNNFVDICRYYKVDTSAYRNADDETKAAIVNAFVGKQIGQSGVDAESVATLINEVAAENGDVAALANEALDFVGYQARLHTNVGIRSLYRYDASALDGSGYSVVAYGAIAGAYVEGADFDDYTVTYDGRNVYADKSNAVVLSSRKGITSFGQAEADATGATFAYTLEYIQPNADEIVNVVDNEGTLTVIGGVSSINEHRNDKIFFRSFIILQNSTTGATYTIYTNGTTATWTGAVSLSEICNHYLTGYEGQFAENVYLKAGANGVADGE